MISPILNSSTEIAVTASHAEFSTVMEPSQYYSYVANVDSWISQGTSPTASAGAGSMYLPAGVAVLIDGRQGPTLSAIRDSSSGVASLTRVVRS